MLNNSSSKSDVEIFDVCVIGLGYVGLTLATAFSLKGLKVSGVEKNENVLQTLRTGRPQFHELGLDEAFKSVIESKRMTLFDHTEIPVARSYVVTVGTPVRDGSVQLQDIETVIKAVSDVMPENSLVVLRSTVKVGTTKQIASKVLSGSGKKFLLAMAPERTLEGKALDELTNLPQIVGGIDMESTDQCSRLFAKLGVEIVKLDSPEEAELAKLLSNTYRDLQFAFANEIAYLSDSMGVSASNVISACNYNYPRMNVAKPGPVAGPCLEKDAYILQASAVDFGTKANLSMQARSTNEEIVDHLIQIIKQKFQLSNESTIGILGLAFKGRPETSDVRGSIVGTISHKLRKLFPEVNLHGWDPLVSKEDASLLGIKMNKLDESLSESDLIIIQTNHTFFTSEEFFLKLKNLTNPQLILIDLWSQIPEKILNELNFKYFALGNSSKAS